ncbi:MAG: hypothetical protein CL853_00830 [Crocinitomicaceae bacterium]|nr:hypothetical protein [Crocinitomicaceae bacterium]|tara:strand:- start:15 stop:335 length:321 start_codon:yes stop_codon:yes gene_type:complete
MRLPLLIFLSILLLYSCQNKEVKKVDFQDIKAICDDLEFQFSSNNIYDSIKLFSQELILVGDTLEIHTIIKEKNEFINSRINEDLLTNETQKSIEKNSESDLYLIN